MRLEPWKAIPGDYRHEKSTRACKSEQGRVPWREEGSPSQYRRSSPVARRKLDPRQKLTPWLHWRVTGTMMDMYARMPARCRRSICPSPEWNARKTGKNSLTFLPKMCICCAIRFFSPEKTASTHWAIRWSISTECQSLGPSWLGYRREGEKVARGGRRAAFSTSSPSVFFESEAFGFWVACNTNEIHHIVASSGQREFNCLLRMAFIVPCLNPL